MSKLTWYYIFELPPSPRPWLPRERVEELVAEFEREIDHMIGMNVGSDGLLHACHTAVRRIEEVFAEEALDRSKRTGPTAMDRLRAQLWPCEAHDIVDCPNCFSS